MSWEIRSSGDGVIYNCRCRVNVFSTASLGHVEKAFEIPLKGPCELVKPMMCNLSLCVCVYSTLYIGQVALCKD